MAYKSKVITVTESVYQQSAKLNHFYKGFSTANSNNNSNNLYDLELIKQDIINNFNTKKGERVMNPEFGSIIWDLIMEPLTEGTTTMLREDIKKICTADPRVTPTQMDITEFSQGYLLEITLSTVDTDQSVNMKLTFNQQTGLTVQ
jgi:phage baseplate assembly protein W